MSSDGRNEISGRFGLTNIRRKSTSVRFKENRLIIGETHPPFSSSSECLRVCVTKNQSLTRVFMCEHRKQQEVNVEFKMTNRDLEKIGHLDRAKRCFSCK